MLASESGSVEQVPPNLEHPSASPTVFLQDPATLETGVHYAFSTRVRVLTRAQLLLRCEEKRSGFRQRSAQQAGLKICGHFPGGMQPACKNPALIVVAWSSSLKQRGKPEGKRIQISSCDRRWSKNKLRKRREAKKERER